MAIDIRTNQFGQLFSEGRESGPHSAVADRRQSRDALFAENFTQRFRRLARGFGASLRGAGVRGLAGALDRALREKAAGVSGLPDPAAANDLPEGLCGPIAHLTPETLMEGYARGLHAAEQFGQFVWLSPRQRQVASPATFAEPVRVAELLAQARVRLTLDREFDAVVKACAGRRALSPRLMHVYSALHDMGFAHSWEARNGVGRLVCGGFGLALGQTFVTLAHFGESPDMDALGLALFNRHLAKRNFALNDGLYDVGLARFGFTPMARAEYSDTLMANAGFGWLGRWQVSGELCEAKAAPQVRRVA